MPLRRAALLAVLVVTSLGAQTAGVSLVSGRVTTTDGDVLPGVTVTIAVPGTSATMVTRADGRFAIETFVSGSASHMLTASLAGFQTASRAGLRLPVGGAIDVGDIRLSPGCLSEIDFVTMGLREQMAVATTIAHVRIEAIGPLRQWNVHGHCLTTSEVTARVERDVHGRRAGTRIRFLPLTSDTRRPYQPGDERVVTLDWDASLQRYSSWGDGYTVTLGVVSLGGVSALDGFDEEMPVDTLFRRLTDMRGAPR